MTDFSKIDFFVNEDNFSKKKDVPSTPVFVNTCESSKVTIAIPTCKRIRTLKDTIESALSQKDFNSYEVLVVDDNSEREDETEQFMSSYKNHPKVSYYKNSKNLGQAGNCNRIFELSKTELIVILHDDDILSPYYLNTIIPFAIRHDADIVSVDSIFWDEARKTRPTFKNEGKASYIRIRPAYMFNLSRCLPTGMLIKKQVGFNEGGFDERFHLSLDYVFIEKAVFKYKVYKYKEGLLIYRWEINSSMKLDNQINFIYVDHYFKKQLGNNLRYPKWFVKFVCKKDAQIRYKRIYEDYGEQEIYLEGERLHKPSLANRILYKIYDITDYYRYRFGL